MKSARSQPEEPRRPAARTGRSPLRASVEQRDALIRALVHELRNPLNIVLTWTHLLADARLDAAARERALASIRSETERQARLLSEVAEYCALGDGGLRLECTEVDPRALVLDAVEATRAGAGDGAAPIEVELEPAPRPLIGDAGRLARTVRTMLGRAVEPANGARRVRVELRSRRARVEIEVDDDGAGLAAGEAARLFEPLPAHESLRDSGGLRLELPIAALVARQHGGRLTATSRGPGLGASLVLRLPS